MAIVVSQVAQPSTKSTCYLSSSSEYKTTTLHSPPTTYSDVAVFNTVAEEEELGNKKGIFTNDWMNIYSLEESSRQRLVSSEEDKDEKRFLVNSHLIYVILNY